MCASVCGYVHVSAGTWSIQKRVSKLPQLVLQAVVGFSTVGDRIQTGLLVENNVSWITEQLLQVQDLEIL